jgi:hypothetical protein
LKDDLPPIPSEPPRKARQLETAPDYWLAVWANDESLTPSQRRKVQTERDRRKVLKPTVIIGFTGTQAGMTPKQRFEVRGLLTAMRPDEVHHGDCVGADATFHDEAIELQVPVVIHPPTNDSKRAWCKGALRVETAKPYLERNKDIVTASTVLIATPKEMSEQLRSGTWSTIRYANNRGTKTIVIMPNGDRKE